VVRMLQQGPLNSQQHVDVARKPSLVIHPQPLMIGKQQLWNRSEGSLDLMFESRRNIIASIAPTLLLTLAPKKVRIDNLNPSSFGSSNC
jgi:hypothetical protein